MNEAKNWKAATFVLAGLLLVILACCAGAWFGSLVGFNFGRRWSREAHHEMPYQMPAPMPGVPTPPMPEVPEMPMPRLGDTAWLGVTFRMVDEGALIVLVVPESAAEKAGLQEGDIITQVDGRAVTASRPLSEHIRRHRPGDRVELTVLRDGRERDISVELGAQPSELPMAPRWREDGL